MITSQNWWTSTAQHAVFIRSARDKYVTQEAALLQLKDTAKSRDWHKAVKEALSIVNIPGTITGDIPSKLEGNSVTKRNSGLASSWHET